MRILAIESSCDETAAAIVEAVNYRPIIHREVVYSQINVHAETGGVIPNIAAGLHTEAMSKVLQEVTNKKRENFDAIAVTTGPGLIGSLLIGVTAAKTLAISRDLPIFGINHLEGHIYSAWLGEKLPELPALFVVVSGGHTELIYMERHLYYKHLGSTRDDAAGEAFDKAARLLDLPYPGGPAIGELAKRGDINAFDLPIGLEERGNLEFSFSGLKAAMFHTISKLPQPLPEHTRADLAASFQHTVAKTIARKTIFALQQLPEINSVCLVGGVSANVYLRSYLEKAIHQERGECEFIVPPFKYCTDNAAMIGAAACLHDLFGKPDNWYNIEANPNQELR